MSGNERFQVVRNWHATIALMMNSEIVCFLTWVDKTGRSYPTIQNCIYTCPLYNNHFYIHCSEHIGLGQTPNIPEPREVNNSVSK